jgi:hypothetical protein
LFWDKLNGQLYLIVDVPIINKWSNNGPIEYFPTSFHHLYLTFLIFLFPFRPWPLACDITFWKHYTQGIYNGRVKRKVKNNLKRNYLLFLLEHIYIYIYIYKKSYLYYLKNHINNFNLLIVLTSQILATN